MGSVLSNRRRQGAGSTMESRPVSEPNPTEGRGSGVPPEDQQTASKRPRNRPKRLIDEIGLEKKQRAYKKAKTSENSTTKRKTTSRPKLKKKPVAMSKVKVVVPETSPKATGRPIRNRRQVKHYPAEEKDEEKIFVADVPIRSIERAGRRKVDNMHPVVRLTYIEEMPIAIQSTPSSTASTKRIKVNSTKTSTNESNNATKEQSGSSRTAARKEKVEACSSTSKTQIPAVNGQNNDDSLARRPTTQARMPEVVGVFEENTTDEEDGTSTSASQKTIEMESNGKEKTSESRSKAKKEVANLDSSEINLGLPEANREVAILSPFRCSTPLIPRPTNLVEEISDDETDGGEDLNNCSTAAVAINDVPEENDDAVANNVPEEKDDADANTVLIEVGRKNVSTQRETQPPRPHGSTSNAVSEAVQSGSSIQGAPLGPALTEAQRLDIYIKLGSFTTYEMFQLLTIINQHGQMPRRKAKDGILHVNLLTLDPPCLMEVCQYVDGIWLTSGRERSNRASSSGNILGGQETGEQSIKLVIRAPHLQFYGGVLYFEPLHTIAPQQ